MKALCILRPQLSSCVVVGANLARSHIARPLTSLGSARTGLEEFYDTKHQLAMAEPVAGRAWLASELRRKSFEDLHKLWFVLYKERNMLLTEQARARRHGMRLARLDRKKMVQKSMARIRRCSPTGTRRFSSRKRQRQSRNPQNP